MGRGEQGMGSVSSRCSATGCGPGRTGTPGAGTGPGGGRQWDQSCNKINGVFVITMELRSFQPRGVH